MFSEDTNSLSSGRKHSHKILKMIENALKEIEYPGTDMNLLEAGIIEKINLSNDIKNVMIFLRVVRLDVTCRIRRAMTIPIIDSIITAIKTKLSRMGFEEIYLIDADTGFRYT